MCAYCKEKIKLDPPDFGGARVIGATRVCAECFEERIPLYNCTICPFCKASYILSVIWEHVRSRHVDCYDSIAKMIEVGVTVEGEKSFEYKKGRDYRKW